MSETNPKGWEPGQLAEIDQMNAESRAKARETARLAALLLAVHGDTQGHRDVSRGMLCLFAGGSVATAAELAGGLAVELAKALGLDVEARQNSAVEPGVFPDEVAEAWHSECGDRPSGGDS